MAARNPFAVRRPPLCGEMFNFSSNSLPPPHPHSDCVPKDQCKPLQSQQASQPGLKTIIDTTGCCPVSKVVCDKSLCPKKPSQCSEAFSVLEKTKTAGGEVCCDEYECRKLEQPTCLSKLIEFRLLFPPSSRNHPTKRSTAE